MRPLLFDVPPLYGTIFTIVVALWVVPELIGAVVLRSTATALKRDQGSYIAVIGGMGIGVLGGILCATRFAELAITSPRIVLFWLGIALMLVGFAFRWYAILTLGRAFTQDVATRADQRLVERGPYRTIRHPAYTGTLLSLLGLGIALANWGSLLVIMLGGLGGLLYRIRVEEQALLDAFGQPYREYMRRTQRLIPFVW